jgi:hypothetical protein
MSGKPIEKVPEQLEIHPAGVRGRGPPHLNGPVLPNYGNRTPVPG